MATIVVVDDDPTNSGLIKMLLELDGFTVTTCSDIQESLAAAQTEVDAFVIDVNLARGANGMDILQAIRAGKTATSPETAVIVTSGDYRREDEALKLGANLFLLKPYSPDLLSDTLNKLLN